MKIIKNKKILLLSFLALSSGPFGYATKTDAGIDNEDFKTIGKCLIGAGVVSLGLYAGYQFFARSDRQLIEDVNSLLANSHNNYGPGLAVMNNYGVTDSNYADENCLYRFATVATETVSIDGYLSSLNSDLRHLKSERDALSKRRLALSREDSVEGAALALQMRNLEQQIVPLFSELTILRDVAKAHVSYFRLFRHYIDINEKYKIEISILPTGNVDHLKRVARGNLAGTYNHYPLITYASQIKRDLDKFYSIINGLRYNYENIKFNSRALAANLDNIYRWIVGDSEYLAEQREKRAEAAREELIRIEQEKLRVEQEKARAKEERNRIEREKAEREAAPTTVVIVPRDGSR